MGGDEIFFMEFLHDIVLILCVALEILDGVKLLSKTLNPWLSVPIFFPRVTLHESIGDITNLIVTPLFYSLTFKENKIFINLWNLLSGIYFIATVPRK